MTRQEIRDIARKRLGETTSAFWTDAELNIYINLGCSDIAWRTKCLRTNGIINVASCEQNIIAEVSNEFVLSTAFPNIFAITDVYFQDQVGGGGDYRRLTPTTTEELDVLNGDWRSLIGRTYLDTGSGITYYNYESQPSTPIYYYWDREEDYMGIWPPPDDVQDGAPMKCYYTYDHTEMSSDSAVPEIPSGIHLAVVDFTVATGLEDRGWGDRANDMWNKYTLKLKDYVTERKNEREDEETIMKNYRNI